MGRQVTPRGAAPLALVIALVSAACGRDTAPPDAAPGDPTLAAIRGDIFKDSCGLSSCHARPTLAAKLDLLDNGLCHLLVRSRSCLFPDKQLVVPGKPEASFLMDKLRGVNLAGEPNEQCGTTNLRMPLGLTPLPAHKLAQVEEWIRAGADCGGDLPVDAGVDATPDAPVEHLADVASITAAATTIPAGARTQVTVTLTRATPSTGQTLILDLDDSTILGVPNALHLDAGQLTATFDALGKLPGMATITASTGTNSKTLTITVSPVATLERAPSGAELAARPRGAIGAPG